MSAVSIISGVQDGKEFKYLRAFATFREAEKAYKEMSAMYAKDRIVLYLDTVELEDK